jgi:hypothetical protein
MTIEIILWIVETRSEHNLKITNMLIVFQEKKNVHANILLTKSDNIRALMMNTNIYPIITSAIPVAS